MITTPLLLYLILIKVIYQIVIIHKQGKYWMKYVLNKKMMILRKLCQKLSADFI